MAGRGSENMIPNVSATSLSEASHSLYRNITLVAGFFSFVAVGALAKEKLFPKVHCSPTDWPAFGPSPMRTATMMQWSRR